MEHWERNPAVDQSNEGGSDPNEPFKAILHPKSKIHSISAHPCADVRMGEDLQFTIAVRLTGLGWYTMWWSLHAQME